MAGRRCASSWMPTRLRWARASDRLLPPRYTTVFSALHSCLLCATWADSSRYLGGFLALPGRIPRATRADFSRYPGGFLALPGRISCETRRSFPRDTAVFSMMARVSFLGTGEALLASHSVIMIASSVIRLSPVWGNRLIFAHTL